jgi:hypothetical protein
MSEEQDTKNPAMDKAMSGGWRPQKDWAGAPEDWIDYREFNVRGELMGRIQEQSSVLNAQKKQIDEHKNALQDMKELSDKMAEREYNKLMKTLKAAKVEAIETSDGEAVNQIDDEIEKLKAQRPVKPVAQTTAGEEKRKTSPEVEAWVSDPRNSWYSTDEFRKGMANGIAVHIAKKNPEWSPGRVLQEMDKRIREELPHRFEGGDPVGGGDSNGRPASTRTKTRTFNDLTPDEQAVATRLEKTGTMKIEEYIEKLDGE